MATIRAVKFIDGVTAVGTGHTHQLVTPSGKFTVEASFTLGSATTCDSLTIDIEGSITGNNWFAIASHSFTSAERSAAAAMFHIVDKPIAYLRGNVTTLTKTGANDVTITAWLLSQ
jgi:hypothetical protein